MFIKFCLYLQVKNAVIEWRSELSSLVTDKNNARQAVCVIEWKSVLSFLVADKNNARQAICVFTCFCIVVDSRENTCLCNVVVRMSLNTCLCIVVVMYYSVVPFLYMCLNPRSFNSQSHSLILLYNSQRRCSLLLTKTSHKFFLLLTKSSLVLLSF